MLTQSAIKNELLRVLRIVEKRGQEEIRAQGHVASGRGMNSVEGVVLPNDGTKIVGGIFAEDYMVGPVDNGVPASRVPYSPGSGAAFSQYIQSLMDWIQRWIKPSYTDEEAKSFAFAIANTAIEEGHPTRGSYSFSENGHRTSWVKRGLEDNERFIEEELELFAIIEAAMASDLGKAAGR